MHPRKIPILLAGALGALPLAFAAGDGGKAPALKVLEGRVLPVAEVLEKGGGRLDPDAAPYWLALVTEKGGVHPIFKDAGGRMFFRDPQLLRRPMRITGRFLPGGFLQCINVHSLKNGKAHEIYYWCEVCQIKTFQKGVCECCGDPLEFREVPLK